MSDPTNGYNRFQLSSQIKTVFIVLSSTQTCDKSVITMPGFRNNIVSTLRLSSLLMTPEQQQYKCIVTCPQLITRANVMLSDFVLFSQKVTWIDV